MLAIWLQGQDGVVAQQQCTNAQGMPCDLPWYDPEILTNGSTFDQKTVLTGKPGVFDAQPDATYLTSTKVPTCCDRQPGIYCLYDPKNPSLRVQCTGTGGPDDNKILTDGCKVGYLANGPCYPKDQSKPNGLGECKNSRKPFPEAAKFDKAPCDYYSNVKIPAGEKRYFCAGLNADHLLECPGNIVTKCARGCFSKIEADGVTPCGKAACAGYNVTMANNAN